MKPILALAVMLALAGCGGNKDQRRGARHAEPAAATTGNSTAASDTVTPTSVPASYQAFPADVRMPIYRWDLLNQKCSGPFHAKTNGACEQRDALGKELLAKGWCFGGADDPEAQHWVLCAEDYPGGESWIASPKADPLQDQ
jgi:hypothetical protein